MPWAQTWNRYRSLQGRTNSRRGPFHLIVRNAIQPGTFQLEVGAYLFKVSSKVQKQLSVNGLIGMGRFEFGTIEDLYALTFTQSLERFDLDLFQRQLMELLCMGDTIEEEITEDDFVVFR